MFCKKLFTRRSSENSKIAKSEGFLATVNLKKENTNTNDVEFTNDVEKIWFEIMETSGSNDPNKVNKIREKCRELKIKLEEMDLPNEETDNIIDDFLKNGNLVKFETFIKKKYKNS